MRGMWYAAFVVHAAMGANALAAQIPRTSYLDHVPPAGKLVSRTLASERLHLIGDTAAPGYVDVAPVDGIDDRRAARLSELTEWFSPILRRNNFSVPRDFMTVTGTRLVLHVDRWADGTLTRSDSLDLSPRGATATQNSSPAASSGDTATATTNARDSTADAAVDDEKLRLLIAELHPHRTSPGYIEPGARREVVLFFDFPGHDERSWRRAYRGHDPQVSTIYAHPFVHEDEASSAERRYSFVIQFWFFYPFNDGPNNHEGEWEHINVSITTKARAAEDSLLPEKRGVLSADDIARLIDVREPLPLDSLAIRSVSYYFHHHVYTLDYLTPPEAHDYPRGWVRARPVPPIWEDASFVRDAIERRVALANGRLATHPLGFIGGNNRGPDELLTIVPRFRGSYNRNSHGTYPFPAVWRTIGALDATEKVFGTLEPRLRRDSLDTAPWDRLIADDHFVSYRREDIVLLPDWERIIGLLERDAGVRRSWGWLVLPIRFGYPASVSPGGGAVPRHDMGNVSPLGPAFHPGWNRPRETEQHHDFDPHVLRIAFAPVSPFTALQNGWGFLNIPIAAAGLVPGVQVVLAQLMPWVSGTLGILGAPPGKTFWPGELPNRFTSFSAGRFVQFGGNGFGRLLPREEDDSIAAFLAANGARIDESSYSRQTSDGNRIWLILHYGDRFAIENTFAIDTTRLGYSVVGADGSPVGAVRGTMTTRQLSGGVRYSFPMFAEEIRGHLRGGYSWTWYTIRNATLNGGTVERPESRGGHVISLEPSSKWWPNSMYGGVGLELFAPRRAWILGRLGYGIVAEMTAVAYPLRGNRCSCILERGDGAVALVFGW